MTPGRILVHPVSLAAAAMYLVNDHVLKAVMPGVLSGKLSDVAGMVVLPVTMVAVCELLLRRELGRPSLVVAIGVTMVGFAAVEVWPIAEAAWCWTWGVMQWPAHAVGAWWEGAPPPALRPVHAWSDPTDLLTLPAGLLALGVRAPLRAKVPPDANGAPPARAFAARPSHRPHPSTRRLPPFAIQRMDELPRLRLVERPLLPLPEAERCP